MQNSIILIIIIGCFHTSIKAQKAYSIATDVSIMRQVSENQKFWAIGQSVQGNFHFSEKESAYASVSYYTNGKFKNSLTASAKDSIVLPRSVNYNVESSLRYRQFSLGWKHYFKGAYNNEDGHNLYYTAGFGMLLGRIQNKHNRLIDTSRYNLAQKSLPGTSNFKRLTLDAALGGEMLLGTGFYLYAEIRTWFRASDYPSPYLYSNDIPALVLLNGGLRILID